MLLIGVTFVILLSVISFVNIKSVNKNLEKSKVQIRNGLIAKGKLLTKNNSLALNGMAQDNAFTAIQELVSSTVADDDDLVYGIYMDREFKPWVYANAENANGIPGKYTPLDDSLARWAGALHEPGFKEYVLDSVQVIEFAAPVGADEAILGYIRYGVSTIAMKEMIEEAFENSRAARTQAIIIIVLTAFVSLAIGYLILRKLAARITLPIGALAESAQIIAEGNYDVAVKPQSNDEIGRLAEHFESMRVTIKKYTDHLQVLIDEKMQQVKDILNNIDQGLFTVNLDGSINNEYSVRANAILRVEDVASCTLRELLRCDADTENAFNSWLDLVKKQYLRVRWSKLSKLAPVRELILPDRAGSDENAYIEVDYQCICDKGGNLVKIMVLAIDETESRIRELQMATEKKRHEYEVKTILSIAHTPAEELAEFMEDTETRIRELEVSVEHHLSEVKRQREYYPGAREYTILKEHIDRMYRDFHTIKGNSGSYDFDRVALLAHKAENCLERLKEPLLERRDLVLRDLQLLLGDMRGAVDEIHGKIRMIFGSEEDMSVRIPEARVNRIIDMGRALCSVTGDSRINELAVECIRLSWKPAKSLLRKYRKLALKLARKLGKSINVIINDETALYPSGFLADIDEVLIHLVRNAVDHGIEEPEVREEFGKGVGHIMFMMDRAEGRRIFSVTDDGHGFDVDRIVEKSIDGNFITVGEAQNLSFREKIDLLYKGGISTSDAVTDISGRGMGMQIIKQKVVALGGTVTIESKLGKGTTISISLPDNYTCGDDCRRE